MCYTSPSADDVLIINMGIIIMTFMFTITRIIYITMQSTIIILIIFSI